MAKLPVLAAGAIGRSAGGVAWRGANPRAMTTDHVATRTLVKSPPELWAECSDAESLTRHMKQSFGEITITRLDPETAIDWEGEHASGTVVIEPSGWGTKVTLTAQTNVEEVEEEEEVNETLEATVPEPDPAVEEVPAPGRGRWRRLIERWRSRAEEPEPVAEEPDVPDEPDEPEEMVELVAPPQPPPQDDDDRPNPEAILSAALDSLGQAHHRPFSRA